MHFACRLYGEGPVRAFWIIPLTVESVVCDSLEVVAQAIGASHDSMDYTSLWGRNYNPL